MEYGVIVKFRTGYSFKTKRQCAWCRGMYFSSIEEIIRKFPHIYFNPEDSILELPESPAYINTIIRELIEKYEKQSK